MQRFLRMIRLHTLDAKCRALFAAAIVVIMSLVLLWPWFLVETLVDEQHLKVAREAARLELLRFHQLPPNARAVPAPSHDETGAPGSPGSPDPFRVEVLGTGAHRPKWVLGAALADPEGHHLPGFERRGLRHLRAHPSESDYYDIAKDDDGGRLYKYLVLLKNTGECLSCHGPSAQSAAVKRFDADENMGAISVTVPLPRDEWVMVGNRLVIVLAGILGAVSASAIFYWIARKLFLGPVEELRGVAVQVASGDMTARTAVETGDEFQQFGETFNRMLETLEAGRKKLQEANASLDIKLGELAELNVALHEANRLKSEFLANVSHELRTPLNSIIGFAELLREQVGDSDRGRRYVNNILAGGRNLLELINDLLDLAKIEAGRMDVRLEMLNAADLCETLLNLVRPLADNKQLRLELEVPEKLPLIRTDPVKVRQIIYNFLSNAIKFTPNGGRVTVAARMSGERFLSVSVADTGPGIAPEHHAAIFEKFRQLDGSVTREHQGTGLGLAISKELAGMLGGHIKLESEPGRGATFTLTIPTDAEGVSPTVRIQAALVS